MGDAGNPTQDSERDSGDRGHHAGKGAVRHHHQPQLPFGRADRGEQAELALPAMRHDDEPRGRDETDQTQHERRRHEHQRHDLGVLRATFDPEEI